MRILLAEDERSLSRAVTALLERSRALCAAALLLRADGETVAVFSGAARLGLV